MAKISIQGRNLRPRQAKISKEVKSEIWLSWFDYEVTCLIPNKKASKRISQNAVLLTFRTRKSQTDVDQKQHTALQMGLFRHKNRVAPALFVPLTRALLTYPPSKKHPNCIRFCMSGQFIGPDIFHCRYDLILVIIINWCYYRWEGVSPDTIKPPLGIEFG